MLSALFFEDEAAAERFPNPVVQILTIKAMGAKTEGGAERYRIVVSDGEMFCQGMVATQSHHLIVDQQLEAYKIVRIKQYQKNVINVKRLGLFKTTPAPGPARPVAENSLLTYGPIAQNSRRA